MDITSDKNRNKNKQATGDFNVFLNGEPFHVEEAFVEKTDINVTVSFFGPEAGQLKRWVTFTIPVNAEPGPYPIDPNDPYVGNVAILFEKTSDATPAPVPDPENPWGWITMNLASKGTFNLKKWDPQVQFISGDFGFEVFAHQQRYTIKAAFKLTAQP
jgi:hypothetical protein